jgi:hypothetical protein
MLLPESKNKMQEEPDYIMIKVFSCRNGFSKKKKKKEKQFRGPKLKMCFATQPLSMSN